MKVDRALFLKLEPGEVPGYVMRICVEGEGFEIRAVSLEARVGEQPVEEVFTASTERAFSGFLKELPNDGDRLFVRYTDETEIETAVVYGPTLVG